ncbi:MAG: cell division protein FtsW [Betaproteobacteria bacterium]|jgi:cell division protein FtsW|nr:cell division protein FtsW [Betaproteobacteria bacterium]
MLSQQPMASVSWIGADRILVSVFAGLLLVGLVMVYSANLPLPSNNAESVFWRSMRGHPIHLLIGLVALLIMTRIPSTMLQALSTPLFFLGIALLLVVAAMKIVLGPSILKDGAVRAIPLGLFTLQPAELMKFFSLLFAAAYVVRRQDRMHTFVRGLLPIGFLMSLVMLLLLYQPDLGSTMVITLITAAILFLGGMSLRIFVPLLLALGAVFVVMVWLTPWRLMRLISYLSPCDPDQVQSTGFQLCGALIAFGRGGFFGSGLGTGIAKMGHLPLPHTDFIFAMMGEEIGFVGVTLVILAFAFIVRRAIEIGRTAMSQERLFAGLVAQGIGVWLGLQTLIHVGVNTGLLPTKGLTLPFISHGGSSMLAVCIAMGTLLRIDVENRQHVRGAKA